MKSGPVLGVSTIAVLISSLLVPISHATTTDYSADATWVVPSGVSVVQVTVSGGNGGSFPGTSELPPASGGAGNELTAGVSVSAGETIYVGLGINGADSPGNTGGASAFGIGSGGNGRTSNANGGGGGGASAIAVDTDIVMIAGGGGGAGSAYSFGSEPFPYSGNGGTAFANPNSSYGGGNGADGVGELQTGVGGGLGGRSTNSTPASDLRYPSSGGGGGGTSTQGFNAGGGGGGAGYYGGLGGGGGGSNLDNAGASGGGGGSSFTSSARIPITHYSSYSAGPTTPGASIAYINFQTASLPAASVDTAYSATMAATFGASDPPDAWAVSPALPAGLTLDPVSGAISGTPTTASTGTYTFTATEYGTGSLISARSSIDLALSVSVEPALTPAFGGATSTSDGFTFSVSNFDASYTWAALSTVGSVVVSGTGLVTVSGISAGSSATVTVTTQRSGYLTGSAQQVGSATGAPTPTPTPTPTPNTTPATASSGADSGVATAAPLLEVIEPGSFTWVQGVNQRLRVFHNSGGYATYTAQPDLPAGLILGINTGIISGIPTAPMAQKTFVITGRNSQGSSRATIQLTVAPVSTETGGPAVVDDQYSIRFPRHSAKSNAKIAAKLDLLTATQLSQPVQLTAIIPTSGKGSVIARKRAVTVRKHLRSNGVNVNSVIYLETAANTGMTRRVLLGPESAR